MYNLGVLLDETGRPDQAEPCLRTAAASGDRHAMHNLGYVLERMGRSAEASRWQRRAGTPPSATETGLGRRSYSYRTPRGHSAKQPGDTR